MKPEMRAEILRLRADGWGYGRIARAVGTYKMAVRRVIDPDLERRQNAGRAAAKRKWENQHDRRACVECGSPLGVGAHRKGVTTCVWCYRGRFDRRLVEMVRLRRAGVGNGEIAARLGVPAYVVANTLSRARRDDPTIPRALYMENRRAAS